MDQIRLISLYSGSSGNAFLVLTPSGNLLIDAGKSAKRLVTDMESVGVGPDLLSALFLTHEHNDHIMALPVFLRHYPVPVYLPARSACVFAKEEKIQPCLHPEEPGFLMTLPCGISVRSFATSHDSMGSMGFRFEIPTVGGKTFSFGYATDLGIVTKEVESTLLGCDAVVLESNHDRELLQTGPYPYYLKRRILSRAGHLSNDDSASFAAKLVENGAKVLFLAHLSRENNRPELAYEACLSSVGGAANILVLEPETPVEWSLEV